jgi:cytochrome c oxidase cbb3-type subunit 2
MNHSTVEKRIGLMGVLIAIVISVGGLVEIVPLYAQRSVVQPSPGVTPYEPLALEGRDIYVREGCYNCHSQMVRPLPAETERYGHYSLAGETVYDHPFQFGSKRTGPDLARVGGRYSDEWHRVHLINPRDVVPESNMPGFPWLAERQVDPESVAKKMRALRAIGVPYTDEQIAAAPEAVAGKSEMEAIIAYMQGLKFRGKPSAELPERHSNASQFEAARQAASEESNQDQSEGQP